MITGSLRRFLFPLCCTVFAVGVVAAPPMKKEVDDPNAPVSYFKRIRPIFQAQCQGCHQPARAKGGYVMTDFAKLMEGGEDCAKDGTHAIVPKDPAKSVLIQQITPANGEAESPKKPPPFPEPSPHPSRRWFGGGPGNHPPPNARQRFDAEPPPVYQRPPVVTSLDFSPDGTLLAIAGFHEVLL